MTRLSLHGTALVLLALLFPMPSTAANRASPDLEEAVRDRGLDPAELIFPETLNEEIEAWAAARLDPTAPPDRMLEDLLNVLSSPEGLGLSYDPSYTATAEEVFAERRANCLAFTHLFVGLSRHYGLETYYLTFEESERYRREDDLVVVSGHVTAGYGPAGTRRVLEFGEVVGANAAATRRISDLTALALFYSNRSAEALRASEEAEALELAEIAVRLAPQLADAWVNLGVARRRTSDLAGAEEAYREAIRIDPDHLPAFQNLTTLLWLEGERRASREIMKLLYRSDNTNPYTYIDLGDINLAVGRLEDAKRFYHRALQLDDSLGEAKAALGLLAAEADRPKRARAWLRRAQKVDPRGRRTLALADRLDDLETGANGT